MGARGGLFEDMSYLWWDLRLRPEYGTLEFRIADTQTSVADAAGVTAFCQALVAMLRERVRAVEPPPVHPTHVISENRWRALRDGLAADLVDPTTGLVESARGRVTRLLLELGPHADRIGCGPELANVWPLLAANGADRQRAWPPSAAFPGCSNGWQTRPSWSPAIYGRPRPSALAASTDTGGSEPPLGAASVDGQWRRLAERAMACTAGRFIVPSCAGPDRLIQLGCGEARGTAIQGGCCGHVWQWGSGGGV